LGERYLHNGASRSQDRALSISAVRSRSWAWSLDRSSFHIAPLHGPQTFISAGSPHLAQVTSPPGAFALSDFRTSSTDRFGCSLLQGPNCSSLIQSSPSQSPVL